MSEDYFVYLEDLNDGILDTDFDSYNLGTQFILEVLCEQDCEFESFEQYKGLVESLEACRCQEDVETIMYDVGTDYIDELEIHISWTDLMFPRPEKSPFINYDI